MRRAGSNSVGIIIADIIAMTMQAVDQTIATAGATYSASDIASLNAATLAFWQSAAPGVPATVALLLPYASSAVACFEKSKAFPLPANLTYDGSGGCATLIANQAVPPASGGPVIQKPVPGQFGQAPTDPLEAACAALQGTWTPSATPPCILAAPIAPTLDGKAACDFLKGTWTPGAAVPCTLLGTLPTTSGVSSSNGMLVGALIAATAVGLVLLTVNMNHASKGKSR